MAEYIGRAKCNLSGNMVDVFADKNGYAYYKDAPTGIKVTFTVRTVSDKFIASIRGNEPAKEEQTQKRGFYDGVLA